MIGFDKRGRIRRGKGGVEEVVIGKGQEEGGFYQGVYEIESE